MRVKHREERAEFPDEEQIPQADGVEITLQLIQSRRRHSRRADGVKIPVK
jgi:hypothetical protein